MYLSPEYHSWSGARTRCNNPRSKDWPRYGERGIKMCRRWDKFENFYADMGPKPSPRHSIERRDNSKGYSKSNCYWVTPAEQQHNTRYAVLITWNDLTLCIAEWARKTGLGHECIRQRYHRGWDPARIFTTPGRSM
jgi:hypothetical protein